MLYVLLYKVRKLKNQDFKPQKSSLSITLFSLMKSLLETWFQRV